MIPFPVLVRLLMVERDLDYLIKAPINICTKTFPSIILLGLVTTEIIRILCAKFSIKIEISIHVAESTTVCFLEFIYV